MNADTGKITAETFTPGVSEITMTPSAIRHVREQLAAENAQGLRLGVTESGCSGYKYVVDFAREKEPDDFVVTLDGDIPVYIDKASLPVVRGTVIDYVTEGLNSAFRFRNPNVTGECGCGESFTVNP